jgi:hypothetical protein
MSIMRFKRTITILSASVLAGSMSMPVFAQDYDSYSRRGDRSWRYAENYSNSDPAARWQRFLNENPDFAHRYRGNPDIVRDPRVMDDQPGLREFFANNPDVRQYAYRSSGNFERTGTPAEKWNRFLNHNPNFAERYRENPGIVNDENVVNDEPELRELFRTDPEVRRYAYNEHQMGRLDLDGDMDSANGDMSGFLATHPGLAKQLREQPGLINDRRFVQNHPNLDQYLRNHPNARY